MPYDLLLANLQVPWPALAARSVTVGGLAVPFAVALSAANILRESRTSAIQPVLRARGNALAACDYFAAAAPYVEAARMAPKTGRRGAAGRHFTKNAFIESVTLTLAIAREEELEAALAAFRADERYAVAMARDAVTIRERAYVSGVRSAVRSAVTRAVSACGAMAGQFTCSAATACGTGSCRFAAPSCRQVTVAAAPGRFYRPVNHVQAGTPFTDAGAAAQLAAAGSFRAGVQVWDADAIGAGDKAA